MSVGIFQSFASLLFGLELIIIAILLFKNKQATVLSSRWDVAKHSVAFLMIYVISLQLGSQDTATAYHFRLLFLIGVSIVLLLYFSRGQVVYGVTASSFNQLLQGTLDKLQIPFIETSEGLQLLSLNATVRVKTTPAFNMASFHLAQGKNHDLENQIATSFKEQLGVSGNALTRSNAIIFFVTGLLIFSFSLSALYYAHQAYVLRHLYD